MNEMENSSFFTVDGKTMMELLNLNGYLDPEDFQPYTSQETMSSKTRGTDDTRYINFFSFPFFFIFFIFFFLACFFNSVIILASSRDMPTHR